jgi:fermentation-respiration switch protein FrsA (DUF1100 family)
VKTDPAPTTRSRKVLRKLTRLLVIIVGTYLIVCLFVLVFQGYLLYFPTREYYCTPTDVGLTFENVTLVTSDDVSLAAWYVPAEKARGSVVFCHANAGNMGDRVVTIKAFHRLGLNVLIFDYRGYGSSEGGPSEQGTYRDAEAAWRFVTEEKDESPERVVIFGRSLGGGIAVDLAARHEPAALVVESTFTSIVDVGKLHYPLLPVGLLCRYRYESIGKVPRVRCPKLFFHGSGDELIPIEIGRRLYEAAAEPKRFIETPGDHNDAGFLYNESYGRMLEAFLNEALPDAAP